MIKNTKFSGYSFYIYLNILGDFQICISLPLIQVTAVLRDDDTKSPMNNDNNDDDVMTVTT